MRKLVVNIVAAIALILILSEPKDRSKKVWVERDNGIGHHLDKGCWCHKGAAFSSCLATPVGFSLICSEGWNSVDWEVNRKRQQGPQVKMQIRQWTKGQAWESMLPAIWLHISSTWLVTPEDKSTCYNKVQDLPEIRSVGTSSEVSRVRSHRPLVGTLSLGLRILPKPGT